MKKIVINMCFGGFGLSEKAMLRYAELKGIKLYPDHTGFLTTYWTVPPEERPVEPRRVTETMTKKKYDEYQERWIEYNERHSACTVYDRDIPRDDPDLVRVVEELGSEANGKYAQLEVIEIPDGIQWEIDEYDGNETVEEVHRSWP